MGDKIRVVLSGIYYPVAIVRYFQAAFLRRSDVDLVSVGPYTGNTIPWANGMFVDCPLPKPDLVLAPGSNAHLDVSYVERLLSQPPDLWIQVDAAYHLLGRPSCRQFYIATDPHCVDYSYQRTQADVFFNMQSPYMKEGDEWLPYAYDSVYHAPKPQELEYDFGIIGADGRQGPLYGPRDQLVHALRAEGHKVMQEFGKAYEDARDLLSRCKVGLNWSTQKDTTARVFETMGMGLALLTNRTPDLAKLGFNDGTDYVGFDTLGEAIDKADELMTEGPALNHYWWQDVSVDGNAKVQEHTWDARVETILEYV